MDPTMEAAVISGCFGLLGVAGTVWVAIAGFRANRRISSESAQAERDRGLWEKRCAAYEEILGVLDDRQAYRLEVMNKARTAKADGTDLASFTPMPSWPTSMTQRRGGQGQTDGLRFAKGTVCVLAKVVDDTAMGLTAVGRTLALYAQHRTPPAGKGELSPDLEDFWPRFEELQRLVQKRDQELTDLIRQELGSDPPPEQPPQIWRGRMASAQGT